MNEEIPELPIDNSERTGLNISLTPATATNIAIAGSTHTVTATVTSTDPAGHPSPAGATIEFDVTSGPNTGQTSHPGNTGCSPSNCATPTTCTTNCQVTWTYASNGTPGTDTIQACFPDRPASVKRPVGDDARQCRTVTKVWAASTPGKVTGGGTIEDPVFSPTGDLLSLPALTASVSGGSAQANFGFVVSDGTTPKGNLEYRDHGNGDVIKATSFSSLAIFDSCGSNTHALFQGKATVNGVPNQDFRVDVDDCDEPGSSPGVGPDMFSITAGSVSNSGPLIGGNIQIHK